MHGGRFDSGYSYVLIHSIVAFFLDLFGVYFSVTNQIHNIDQPFADMATCLFCIGLVTSTGRS